MTRQGNYEVKKQVDAKKIYTLGYFEGVSLIGEYNLLFEKLPEISIICSNYCTVGALEKHDFEEMLS